MLLFINMENLNQADQFQKELKPSHMRFTLMWYGMFINLGLMILILILYVFTIGFVIVSGALTVTVMVLTKFVATPWSQNEKPNIILKIVALVIAILGILSAGANLIIMIQLITTAGYVAPLYIVITVAYLVIEFLFYLTFILLFIKAEQLDKKFPGVMGGECLLQSNDEEGQLNTNNGNPGGQPGTNGQNVSPTDSTHFYQPETQNSPDPNYNSQSDIERNGNISGNQANQIAKDNGN